MQTRTLGNNLKVSVIGLGCMGMSASYGTDESQMQTLDEALAPEKIAGPRYAPQFFATIDG